jgi:hypothetical protein
VTSRSSAASLKYLSDHSSVPVSPLAMARVETPTISRPRAPGLRELGLRSQIRLFTQLRLLCLRVTLCRSANEPNGNRPALAIVQIVQMRYIRANGHASCQCMTFRLGYKMSSLALLASPTDLPDGTNPHVFCSRPTSVSQCIRLG